MSCQFQTPVQLPPDCMSNFHPLSLNDSMLENANIACNFLFLPLINQAG
jgi:hypothetical protein